MSYVQCLSSHSAHQYKLTHDVSLDSLNDLDNDPTLSSDYHPLSKSWTHNGASHVALNHFDNDCISHVNANNVRNTEAHGQSTSWMCRSDTLCTSECISDYIPRTPAHGNTACGTEHYHRSESLDNRDGRRERSTTVHNLVDSENVPRRRHRTSSRTRNSSSCYSPEVLRRQFSTQTSGEDGCGSTSGSGNNAKKNVRSQPPPKDYNAPKRPTYTPQSSVEENESYRGRRTPQKGLDEKLSVFSNKSSPEEDEPGPRSFYRQDSRSSDSCVSDENTRRQSEDGSDCSQRSVRAMGRPARTPRKGRRPRKLPDIPPSAKATAAAATITFMTASGTLRSCSLTQLSSLLTEVRDNKETEILQRSLSSVDRSLADELSEADPSLKLTNGVAASPACLRSDESSPESNVEFEQPLYRNRHVSGSSQKSNVTVKSETTERDIMSMSTSTVGSQGESEAKVKAEETARETHKRDSREFDVSQNFIDDIPSSPRRCPIKRSIREQKAHIEDALLSNSIQTCGTSSLALLDDEKRNFRDEFPAEDKSVKRLQCFNNSMRTNSMDSLARSRRSSMQSTLSFDVEDLDATHRGCHKFIPRHSDELFIEIGDPIAVQSEDDDLWCSGFNLRTGKYGIFPSAYATDLSILEDEESYLRPVKFILRFLGSVEVGQHKGTEVLAQAINKVAMSRRSTLDAKPPPLILLEINEHGIKMSEKDKKKEKVSDGSDVPMSPSKRAASIRARLAKILSKEKEASLNHFFSLKNIALCGNHPRNDRYFAFITKHPQQRRFACHVFLGEQSTKSIAEAFGRVFKPFYTQYMAFVHPTEDIWME